MQLELWWRTWFICRWKLGYVCGHRRMLVRWDQLCNLRSFGLVGLWCLWMVCVVRVLLFQWSRVYMWSNLCLWSLALLALGICCNLTQLGVCALGAWLRDRFHEDIACFLVFDARLWRQAVRRMAFVLWNRVLVGFAVSYVVLFGFSGCLGWSWLFSVGVIVDLDPCEIMLCLAALGWHSLDEVVLVHVRACSVHWCRGSWLLCTVVLV